MEALTPPWFLTILGMAARRSRPKYLSMPAMVYSNVPNKWKFTIYKSQIHFFALGLNGDHFKTNQVNLSSRITRPHRLLWIKLISVLKSNISSLNCLRI